MGRVRSVGHSAQEWVRDVGQADPKMLKEARSSADRGEVTDDDFDHPTTPRPLRTLLGALVVIVAIGAIVATSLVTQDAAADQETFCTLEGILGPATNSSDYGLVIVVDANEQQDILNGCPHGWGDVSLTPDCRLWEESTQVGTVEPTRCAELKAKAR